MGKVLIIFGSKSDEKVFYRIAEIFKKSNIPYDLHVSSAHRSPEEVDEIIAADYSIIIAGAGLSAALPGVVAAKSIVPVIGVPVKSNYEGLDALLSAMQLPPGTPVLSVGVNQAEVAAQSAINMLKLREKVILIGEDGHKAVEKAKKLLEHFSVPYEFSRHADKDAVNIEFVYFDEPVEKKDELVIYCPLLLENDDTAEAALNLLKHSVHGLWVGLESGENAALAAIRILNIADDRYGPSLKKYKEEMRNKVVEDDKSLKR